MPVKGSVPKARYRTSAVACPLELLRVEGFGFRLCLGEETFREEGIPSVGEV